MLSLKCVFNYDGYDQNVLEEINLSIKGANVAIVGESGAGKSTLVSLIPRFYEPTKGSIYIDDQDVRGVKKASLRKQIGFVQQNVFLFDGTIRENLRYGKVDATDQEMLEALHLANLYFYRFSCRWVRHRVGERLLDYRGKNR